MSQYTRAFSFILLISIITTGFCFSAPQANGPRAGMKSLLARLAVVNRDVSRILLRASKPGAQPDASWRKQSSSVLMELQRLRHQSAKLTSQQQNRLRVGMDRTQRKLEILKLAEKNAAFRTAQRELEARHKAAKHPVLAELSGPPVPGSMTGIITDAATLQTLDNIPVDLYDANGDYVNTGYTDANGVYLVGNLLTGDYYAKASPPQTYIPELFNNIPCPRGNCDSLSGTAIHVQYGSTTSGIDFALETGGTISGTVVDAAGGDPVAFTEVDIYNSNGDFVSSGYTDEYGDYRADRLPTGNYKVATADTGNYANELYDNLPCQPSCWIPGGISVGVLAPNDTPNINFALDRMGSISGKVKDTANHALAGVEVDIYDSDGYQVSYGYTDASGNYTANRVSTGNHYAITRNSTDFVDELYDNIPCQRHCDFQTGTIIPVLSAQDTPNINFALLKGSKITGRVTDLTTGANITSGTVTIYDTETYTISTAAVLSNGTYTAIGVAAGTYYAVAESDNYVAQLYASTPCPFNSCDHTSGDPIQVPPTQTVTGINFKLTRGGAIQGAVSDAVTHQPVDGSLQIFDEWGFSVAYGYTDAAGAYRFSGLPTGTYYVGVRSDIYQDELYDNIFWSGNGYSDALDGTPIQVTAPQTQSIDLLLDLGGTISGTVTDASSGLPVADVAIQIRDTNGNYRYAYTNPDGTYTVRGLATGSYRAQAYESNYLSVLYNGIPCDPDCDPANGTLIPVTAPNDTGGIDFALTKGGEISGTLRDSVSGLPLEYGNVDIFDSTGAYKGYGYTYPDFNGNYSTPLLPAGTYYLRTSSWSYMTELYNNMPCLWSQCDPLTGTPVSVLAGVTTAGIDVSLSHGNAGISGTLLDATTNLPVAGALVNVYHAGQQDSVAASLSDASGQYASGPLPAGTYYVKVSGAGHLGVLYGGVPCPFTCDPTTGTGVVVLDGVVTTGIDFSLVAGGAIDGRATRDVGGEGVQDALISLFDSTGQLVEASYTDFAGHYNISGLPAGTYYAREYGMGSYAVELYDNIQCFDETCNPLGGTPIQVNSGQVASNINFGLSLAGAMRGFVRDGTTQAGLEGFTVKILKQDGTPVKAMLSGKHGIYWFGGLPENNYYVMVMGGGIYDDQLYNGVNCPGGICNLAEGTLVHVTKNYAPPPVNFNMGVESCEFCDDFDDGQLNPNWTYVKPAWSEANGLLIGNGMIKKTTAYAEPVFAGCSDCSLNFAVETSGGIGAKVWLFGWHSGKTQMELLMRPDRGRWILKERVNGAIVQKAKGIKAILPNTLYAVRMSYSANRLQVFVDDMGTPLITMTPTTVPNGSVGAAVRNTTGSLDYIHID